MPHFKDNDAKFARGTTTHLGTMLTETNDNETYFGS
jgi:hypothetical protein